MTKVLKDFRCKITKRIYRMGETYDGDRVEELQKLGYVAVVEDVELNPEEKSQEADEGAGNEPAEEPRKRAKRDDSG